MFSAREMMASPSSLFSAYASLMASAILIRSILNDLLPQPIQLFLLAIFDRLFKRKTNQLTLVIEEFGNSPTRNHIFEAAELYLSTRIGSHVDCLKIYNGPNQKRISIHLKESERLTDSHEGIELNWKFLCVEQERSNQRDPTLWVGSNARRSFELSFEKKHKERILNSYVPYMQERADELKKKERILKMYTLCHFHSSLGCGSSWNSIKFEHPSSFDTLAMEAEQKKAVMTDLDRFQGRKEFYKRVGRAWKRGYLLYGPPGTGKSSLVAAMANYLKFDVYDLQLSNAVADSDLRNLLLGIANRSVLVIEDIDCSIDLPDRLPACEANNKNCSIRPRLTLSGLLNFIDGLWSSWGNERIIVFTTNNVEKIDPALLRPGRMDMHVHMSYCTFHSFMILACNCLGVSEAELSHCHGHVLTKIKSLIAETKVTPAEVAEEFMKSEDPGVALDGLVKLLGKRNRNKSGETEDSIGAEKEAKANNS